MMPWSQSLLLLTALLAALLAVTCAQKSPQFVYSQSNKIMLSWGDVWEVGVSNKLAFLNKGKTLTIRINIGGDVSGSFGSKILKYKCSDSGASMEVALDSVQLNMQYCIDTMPFGLSKVSGKEGVDYHFTLLGSSTFDIVFSQKVQLQVRVDFTSGSIFSNSLFVYNLDAISQSSITDAMPGVVINNYYQRFLTNDAINFLIQMNSTSDPFSSFQFIDPQIVARIRSAPAFIKAKINIGAVLQFDGGDCQTFQAHLVSMFVNYYSKMNEQNIGLLKHMALGLDDGKLYYSTYGLTTAIADFFKKMAPNEISICSLTSFAGEAQPYFKVDEVKQKIPKSLVSYQQRGSRTRQCSLVGTSASQSVSIFAGMDYTPLVCPIICDDATIVYSFYHGNKQLVPNSDNKWTFYQGPRISRTGNIIEFPPELFENDSGAYRCEAGGISFTFDVKIVSMPQFLTRLHEEEGKMVSGDLPPVMYAMENETLSYNCTVYFTNMDSVSIAPDFFTISTAEQKWRKLDLAQFNSLFSSSDSIVSQSIASQNETKTLNLTISRVPYSDPSTYLNFTHRLVCNAEVSPADANKVGLPSYSVQSSSNVVFLKRPSILSFNRTFAKDCSVQECSNKNGGNFEVSLNSDLTRWLNEAGVKVTAYFRIDNELLDNIHSIHAKDVSESLFDPETNRLLFKVFPTRNQNVIEILQRYKTLTPVFNFGYNDVDSSKISNLRLYKERYGQPSVSFREFDCRADKTCFYSTDFDTSSQLSELSISLGFEWISDLPLEPASASAGLIAGISLAVLIVIMAIILLVLLLRRDSGQTYMVDEKERQQGNNPDLEAKEEHFKEYQPLEEAPMQVRRASLNSAVSIGSRDDKELDEYKDDDLDMGKFNEDGSFLGEYHDGDKQNQKQQ